MNPLNVLKRPILSEKSLHAREKHSKYVFQVQKNATKTEIKKAVEKVFEVEVQSINTSITRGKLKRRGMTVSLGSSTKKAVVTLKSGQTIKMFEDQ